VNESLVAYNDLTQLDGVPTSRATPFIERTPLTKRTPAGRSAYEAVAALLVATLMAMVAMAATAAIGLWIGCAPSVIVICSVITFVLVLAISASHIRAL
jgi:fatty acid desaturase